MGLKSKDWLLFPSSRHQLSPFQVICVSSSLPSHLAMLESGKWTSVSKNQPCIDSQLLCGISISSLLLCQPEVNADKKQACYLHCFFSFCLGHWCCVHQRLMGNKLSGAGTPHGRATIDTQKAPCKYCKLHGWVNVNYKNKILKSVSSHIQS